MLKSTNTHADSTPRMRSLLYQQESILWHVWWCTWHTPIHWVDTSRAKSHGFGSTSIDLALIWRDSCCCTSAASDPVCPPFGMYVIGLLPHLFWGQKYILAIMSLPPTTLCWWPSVKHCPGICGNVQSCQYPLFTTCRWLGWWRDLIKHWSKCFGRWYCRVHMTRILCAFCCP